VTISDSIASVSGSFKISVINTPPYFVSEFPSDFTMKFNTTYVYFVPKYADDEGHSVTVTIDTVPAGLMSFASVIDNT
jgi:hypothetical protein